MLQGSALLSAFSSCPQTLGWVFLLTSNHPPLGFHLQLPSSLWGFLVAGGSQPGLEELWGCRRGPGTLPVLGPPGHLLLPKNHNVERAGGTSQVGFVVQGCQCQVGCGSWGSPCPHQNPAVPSCAPAVPQLCRPCLRVSRWWPRGAPRSPCVPAPPQRPFHEQRFPDSSQLFSRGPRPLLACATRANGEGK